MGQRLVEAWGPPKVEGWEGSSAAGSGQATVAASAPDCEVVNGREQGESHEWVGTAKTLKVRPRVQRIIHIENHNIGFG